ncbi:MAG: hypothetical protein WA021_00720, partial [Minisyncoccia bacterium]
MSQTSDEIFKDGVRYVRSKIAAHNVGLVPDYVSRMCRSGQVCGVRHSGAWWVDEESLASFLSEQALEYEDFKRRKSLAGKIALNSEPVPVSARVTTKAHPHILKRHLQRTRRINVVRTSTPIVLGLLLFASIGVVFGSSVQGFFTRSTMAGLDGAPERNLAASSIPVLDSAANRVYWFFCPLFSDCLGIYEPIFVFNTRQLQSPPVFTSNVLPPSPPITTITNPIIQHTIETRTITSGLTRAELEARLAALAWDLRQSLMFSSNTTYRQDDILSDSFGDALGGTLEDLTIVDSSWTGGTITNATITGGSITGVSVSATSLTGIVPVANGGTGTSTYEVGDLLYADAGDSLARLPIGANNRVLKVVGGVPTWSVESGGSGGDGVWATTTDDLAIYPEDFTDVVIIGDDATSTTGNIFEVDGNSLFGGSVIVQGGATSTTLGLTGLTSALLSTNAQGSVVATSSISTSLLAGALGTINGTSFNRGASITISAASSTLLADNNTFLNTITGSISGNAGTATALQTARTINGVSFNGTADITILAASSTLISDLNTWSARQIFSNSSTTLASFAYASSTEWWGGGLLTSCNGGNVLTWSNGTFGCAADQTGSGGNPFPSNATTTMLTFNGGLMAFSSSTIANLSMTNSTTTNATTTNLAVTSLPSALLATDANGRVYATTSISGALVNDTINAFIHASTTIPKTYTSNVFSALQTFGNASSTLFSTSYASSTQYFGAGLADCNTNNVLTWTAGRFGCEADDQGSGGGNPFPGNATTTLLTFSGGLMSFSSSTISNLSSTNATTTNATSTSLFATNANVTNGTTSNLAITSLPSALLATDANGSVYATTSIRSTLVAGSLGSINGTTFNRGDSILVTAASSTLLADANTFSGSNVFSSTITGSISGNAGTATALQTPRTINGVAFDGTANITVTAASSTLLANTNTWSSLQTFSNVLITGSSTFQNFTAINSTTSNATTTNLAVTGYASTTALTVSSLNSASCDVKANAGGVLVCGTDATGLTAYDAWTHPSAGVSATTSSMIFSAASSTFVGGVSINTATTTAATTTALAISGTPSALLATRADGSVYATTSIASTLVAGSLGTINGTTFNRGDSITVTAASSTLLGDVNAWTALQTFSNVLLTGSSTFQNFTALNTTTTNATTSSFAITSLPSALLATDANGRVYATTSISGALVNDSINTFIHASTTIPKTYTANVFTGAQTLSGGLTLTGLNGPLQANNGLVSATTSILAIYGGTGQTAYDVGDILYADTTGSLARLPIGGAGEVLKVVGGIPDWSTDLTTGSGGGGGFWSTTTDDLALYPTDQSDVVVVGNNATATANSIFEVFGRSYFSNNVGIGTTSPGTRLGVTGDAVIAGNVTAARFFATSTAASVFPYASSTAISVSGTGYFGNLLTTSSSTLQNFIFVNATGSQATTTSLAITGITNSLLKTDGNGSVIPAVAGVDYANFAFPFTPTSNFNANTNATSTALSLLGGLNASSTVRFGNAGVANQFFFDSANGFLGLGTTSNASTKFAIENTTSTSTLAIAGGSVFHTASGTPTRLSALTSVTTAGDVFVMGKYAYMSVSTTDLRIVDISNPKFPVQTGAYSTGDFVTGGMVVSGKYAYMGISTALGYGGLAIFDVSNASSPRLVSSTVTNLLSTAADVYVSGAYAYLTLNGGGLYVMDISNPVAPTVIRRLTLTAPGEMFASGKYLYIADSTSGLRIVDIESPGNPILVGTFDTTVASGVYVSGKLAYVTDSLVANDLYIINVANPASPTQLAALALPGTTDARFVLVSGKYAYVAAGPEGVYVVDVASSTAPFVVGNTDSVSTHEASRLDISGKYLYVAEGEGGLAIMDINGIETPSLYAGNIETSVLQVTDNLFVGGDIFANGGLNVGQSGIFSRGTGVFTRFATTSLAAAPVLMASLTDSNNSSLVDVMQLTHMASSTAANGIGTGLLFAAEDGSASSTATTTARIGAILTSVSASAPTSVLTFSTKNSNTGLTEWMRLTENGSLGIGTTTPFAKLSVQGTLNQTNPVFEVASSSNAVKFLSVAGDGFGTTTLSGLNVSGSATTTSNVGLRITSTTQGISLAGLTNCTEALETDADGNIICGTDSTSTGAANDFIFATNYGVLAAATTSPLWVQNGLFASSTSHFVNADFINTTTTAATTTNLAITGTPSALLSTNASGAVVATTSIASSFVAGSLGSINGTTFNRGDSILVTAASSTLLADANTFSGSNVFSSTITGSISGNAGTATALQTPRTINGVAFDGTGNITITAASSTLLANNNTWSSLQTFSNVLITGSSTFQNFTAQNTTTTNATTTNLAVTGTASTSALTVSSLNSASCDVKASTGGVLVCGTDATGLTAYDAWTHPSGGVSATTSSMIFSAASSTFIGLSVTNATATNATTTNLAITSLPSALLATDANGRVYATTSISGALVNDSINTFIHASTTIPKTYTTNTFSALQTFTNGITSNALTLGSLNGPLQANNGIVSATTSVGVLYGGTGLTSAPTFGQMLVGNASGGYTLTATSSLGLPTFGYPFATESNFGVTVNSTTTPLWLRAGLQASSTAHFTDLSSVGIFSFATSSNNASSSLVKFGGNPFITASSTGGNTSVGQRALNAITDGASNQAFGYQAMQFTTVGDENSIFGRSAGRFTNGNRNVALGYLALSGNQVAAVTHSSNVALGAEALATISTGADNIAIGDSALQSLTSGARNIAIGTLTAGALATFQTGTDSTMVGHGAVNLGTGSFLSAFGRSALNQSSGNYNTAFGYSAGSSITSGFGNIMIGPSPTAGNLSTGDGNIGIGYNTFFPSATGDNQLNIGGLLFGTLPATTTAFTLPTTGTFGIASSTPFGLLSVHANNGSSNQNLFVVGSSTANATTTLFSISNTGLVTFANMTGGQATTSNLAITNVPSALLSTNAQGAVVATTSIASTLVAGSLGTINGTTFNRGDSITVTAASSTLLNDLNTWSNLQTFSNVLITGSSTFQNFTFVNATGSQATTTSLAVSSIASGSLVKTTTGGALIAAVAGTDYANFAFPFTATNNFNANVNSTTTTLLLTNGLQASSTVRFGNAGGSQFLFDSSTGRLGIGTTTPFAKLSIQGTLLQTNPIFEVASSSDAIKFLSVAGNGFGTTTLSGLTIAGSATTTSNVGFRITSGCYETATGQCLSAGTFVSGAGSGGANRVSYWSDASTITSDANFTFDGTTMSARELRAFANNPYIYVDDSDTATADLQIGAADGSATINVDLSNNVANSSLGLWIDNSERARLTSTGAFAVGTSTPYATTTIWGRTAGTILEVVANASSTVFSVAQSGATTTNLAVTGTASTSALTVSNLTAASCDVKANAGGVLVCGTDATGLTAYDAWTHPSAGVSATSSGMIFSAASSTFVGGVSINTATTTAATTTALAISGTPSALLATRADGSVYATTSIASTLVAGSLGTINGTTFNRGDSITVTAASSTLLANSNTFTGANMFLASTTIGAGTQTTGLTISGGATTTGNALFQSGLLVLGSTTLQNVTFVNATG